MNHRFHRDRQGNIHVDTLIDGERWQHHVHSAADFELWRGLVAENLLTALSSEDCDCNLAVGQVLEHNGRIWNHPQFV